MQNVEDTPRNDQFSSENPWESSFQGINAPSGKFYNVNSTKAHYPGPSRPKILPSLPPITSDHSMTPS